MDAVEEMRLNGICDFWYDGSSRLAIDTTGAEGG
jgi:hypothetical protein